MEKLTDYSDTLSIRQLRILQLIADGEPNKRIAEVFGVKENAIKKHVSAIYRRLGATDRPNAVCIGMRKGYIE